MDQYEMKHASSEISPDGPQNDTREWLYVLPGILLCLAALAMLIADILFPGMADRQYDLYPAICRTVMVISSAVMLLQAAGRRSGFLQKPDLTDVFFAGFVLLMLVSTCINGFTHEALFSVPYRYVGVVDLMVYIAVYMGCSRRIASKRLKNAFLMYFMLTADLIGGVFIYDWFIKDIPAIGSENPASAIFFHDNHYAYFLVIAIMISIGYFIYGNVSEMIAGLVSMLLNLFALGVNRTAGCFLAVGASVVIIFIYTVIRHREYSRRALILAVSYLAGAIFLIIANGILRDDLILLVKEVCEILRGGDTTYAGHGRWRLWKITVDYIIDEPFFGYGCEGISETLYDYVEIASPHNEPLAYAAFFGIPAAILYVAGCISSIVKGLRTGGSDTGRVIAAFAAMGYFISSLFGVAMFYTAPYFFILIGLAVSDNES